MLPALFRQPVQRLHLVRVAVYVPAVVLVLHPMDQTCCMQKPKVRHRHKVHCTRQLSTAVC